MAIMRMVSITLVTGLGLALALLAVLVEASPSLNRASAPDAMVSPQAESLASVGPTSPTVPVRLVFIHHSTGGNWLNDNLRALLNANNYYVVDTNYGWGAPCTDCSGCGGSGEVQIGDCTDIGHWYNWFVGPDRDTYMNALYTSNDHANLNRGVANPGGQNTIVMFKSCFPNSKLGGSPNDPPNTGENPLRGYSALPPYHTVSNVKGIYNDLLTFFATRQDKLFVAITAPPLVQSGTTPGQAANARAFNTWLVNDWLDNYPYNNVAVFDFYNVLTSNGGSTRTNDPNTNDLGWADGNHHRYWNGAIEHTTSVLNDYSAYYGRSFPSDSHPTAAGNQKATGEFVPWLNSHYHDWHTGATEKRASMANPRHGQAVTYTIVVKGLAAPLTATVHLTDRVPTGLSYIPGTLTATAGTVIPAAPTLRWSGFLTPTPAVTITYSVIIVTDAVQVITNAAVIAASGFPPITRTATIIANGYSVYLPVIKRE